MATDQISSNTVPNLSSSSSSKSSLVTFFHTISVKLDHKNYLLWRQQVLAAIRGHQLEKFINGDSETPSKFLSAEDASQGIINQDFLSFQQQDQLLLSWILSSMTESVLTRMVGCETSAQVWHEVELFFSSHTKAKIKQFKTLLQSTRKDSLSVTDYLLKIKTLVDSLASVGNPISVNDHIDAIFDGLPEEYDSFITSVTSRTGSYSVSEIEALLLAQEARIEKHHKPVELAQANVATQQHSNYWRKPYNGANGNNSRFQRNQHFQSPPSPANSFQHFQLGNNQRGGRTNGRSGRKQRPQVYCQVCGKFGHIAYHCFHRFNQGYPGPYELQSPQPPFHRPPPMQAMLATPDTVGDTAWYPDSGATHHLTVDSSNLNTKSEYTGHDKVYMGNGSGFQDNPLARDT